MNYMFKKIENLESFLIDKSFGVDLLIPSDDADCLSFFQNGDKMTVNVKTGEINWDPLIPKEMFSSKLSVRFHSWFKNGLISEKS